MYRPCRAREGELPEGQERPVWTATRRAVWQLIPECSCLHAARPVAVPYRRQHIVKSQFQKAVRYHQFLIFCSFLFHKFGVKWDQIRKGGTEYASSWPWLWSPAPRLRAAPSRFWSAPSAAAPGLLLPARLLLLCGGRRSHWRHHCAAVRDLLNTGKPSYPLRAADSRPCKRARGRSVIWG